MQTSQFGQQLLAATPEDRQRLITQLPEGIGERDVVGLAERARAAADANPPESLRIADVAWELADALDAGRGRAVALRARAVALWSHGRWTEALDAFHAGASIAEQAGDALLAAQIP